MSPSNILSAAIAMPDALGSTNPYTGAITGKSNTSTQLAATPATPNYAAQLTASNNALAQMESKLGASLAPGQVVGGFNSQANYQNALSNATNQEGALYNQYANQINSYYSGQESLAQQQNQLDLGNIQNQLTNTLAGNEIGRQRVQQDTSNSLYNLANQQQNYLAQQGLSQQQSYTSNSQAAGADNSIGGISQQNLVNQTTGYRLGQQQEQAGYNVQQYAQNLFQNRSIEDLSRADTMAQQGANTMTAQSNFNLNESVAQNQFAQQQAIQQNTTSENSAIQSQAKANALYGASQFLNGLRTSPQNLTATQQSLYGFLGAL